MPIQVTPYVFYPLNSQVITLTGLQDFLTGNYLNGAAVAATLINDKGEDDSVINDLPMIYLQGTNGDYQGIVPDSFDAMPGSRYLLQITATQGTEQAVWTYNAAVRYRVQ